MPCKPTCRNETSQTGKSAEGFLRKTWTNIKGRSKRFCSVLVISKEWTQFRLGSLMNGTTALHQIKSIIWNISREVWHDPPLTPIRITFTRFLSVHPFSLFFFSIFSVSLRIVPHAIYGFCFINNAGGSWLTLHLFLSSFPLEVTVHIGVSVQRRDRCTGM